MPVDVQPQCSVCKWRRCFRVPSQDLNKQIYSAYPQAVQRGLLTMELLLIERENAVVELFSKLLCPYSSRANHYSILMRLMLISLYNLQTCLPDYLGPSLCFTYGQRWYSGSIPVDISWLVKYHPLCSNEKPQHVVIRWMLWIYLPLNTLF